MCQSQCVVETAGKKTPRNLPKATHTAAIVPVWITRNSVQPIEEAPERAQRLTQIDILAARLRHHCSQFAVAERRDECHNAVTTQAPRKSAGEFVARAMSAPTMKMPEPIIDPVNDRRRAEEAKALHHAGGLSSLFAVVLDLRSVEVTWLGFT